MHEGLVVLQKTEAENNKQSTRATTRATSYEVSESRVVMFVNRQAKKLFDNFIGQIPIVV